MTCRGYRIFYLFLKAGGCRHPKKNKKLPFRLWINPRSRPPLCILPSCSDSWKETPLTSSCKQQQDQHAPEWQHLQYCNSTQEHKTADYPIFYVELLTADSWMLGTREACVWQNEIQQCCGQYNCVAFMNGEHSAHVGLSRPRTEFIAAVTLHKKETSEWIQMFRVEWEHSSFIV